jgi:hypothetical protein
MNKKLNKKKLAKGSEPIPPAKIIPPKKGKGSKKKPKHKKRFFEEFLKQPLFFKRYRFTFTKSGFLL